MRISYTMIYSQSQYNINQQYEEVYSLNEKISTGKEVNRPSDDPIAAGKILGYRSTISALEQYSSNIERGSTWLRYTESTLTQAEELIMNARTLAEQMANEPYEAQMEIIAPQVKQIAEQLLQIANTSVSGKFIFSGHKTETIPFTMDEELNVTYHGDNNKIKYSIDETSDVAVNITGQETFIDGINVFDVLKDFYRALQGGDTLDVGPVLEDLGTALDQIVTQRSITGTAMTRFESAANVVEELEFLTEDLLVNTEDTDMVKRLTDLKSRETALNASMQSATILTRLSLLNYM